MRKAMVSAVVSIVSMLAFAGTASAVEQYMFEPGENITKQGVITFSIGGLQLECNVALAGAMQAGWIAAGAGGEKIGEITEVAIGPGPFGCNLLAQLPIAREMNLQRFLEAGANEVKPNEANAEQLTGYLKTFTMDIRVTIFNGCLYSGPVGTLAGLAAAEGEPDHHYTVEQLTILDGTALPLNQGGPECPPEMGLAGAFNTEPAQTLIAR